jgi:hypothetical protein
MGVRTAADLLRTGEGLAGEHTDSEAAEERPYRIAGKAGAQEMIQAALDMWLVGAAARTARARAGRVCAGLAPRLSLPH